MNHRTHLPDADTSPSPSPSPQEALDSACAQVGLDVAGAELIRLAENAIYRLPGGVVARVSRPGQVDTARREVAVSAWLQQRHFPVVRALTGLPQPVEVAGRAVTFWRNSHRIPPPARATSGPCCGACTR